jgi:hypothetical protein
MASAAVPALSTGAIMGVTSRTRLSEGADITTGTCTDCSVWVMVMLVAAEFGSAANRPVRVSAEVLPGACTNT